MPLFQKSVLRKHIDDLDKIALGNAYERFVTNYRTPEKLANIRAAKEEQYQEGFLRDLFVDVLGYTLNPNPNFNLTTECKNEKDSKKADGAILQNDIALAVIELKGTDTVDLDHVEDQAFGYKNNQKGCRYVITSNFEKLRFYIDDSVEHLEFDLFEMKLDSFYLFYLCLQKDNLLKNIPAAIKEASVNEEQGITKKLYKDYSTFKRLLYQNICEQNPAYDKLIVYKKTQKLLDRFLFILFAEDKQLLPPNSIREILKQWQMLKDNDAYFPLYNRYQLYFGYMNTGHKGKVHDIFAYNGGLFAPDEVLDTIKIDDQLLYDSTYALSQYDFETEVDVNILGHIFEHSLNDVDAVTAESEGKQLEKEKTRRKKDGVFYTPKYITKYIVENTVGKLCAEKKTELEIKDEDYSGGKKKKDKKALNDKLESYTQWLLQLTILDPACGSGAFLNQALEFLIAEHRKVDELRSKLFEDTIQLSDVENHILENNLFGVDLNEESIEIAKLSLWLRTAKKGRKLSSLNSNIKCGNSLIDDKGVAGDKAFLWKEEFKEVFAKGGFDVVVGNPPYVSLEDISEQEKEFYRKNFEELERKYDTSVIFKLKVLKLLKSEGILGFITTVTWQTGENYTKVREHILRDYNLLEIINLPFDVFAEAYVDTGIVLLKKNGKEKSYKIYCYDKSDSIKTLEFIPFQIVNKDSIDKSSWKIILNAATQNIYNKAKSRKDVKLLGEISISTQGLSPSRFVILNANNEEQSLFPFLLEGQAYQYLFLDEIVGYTDMADKPTLTQFYDAKPKILIRRLINRQDRLTVSYTEKKMVFKKDVNPFIITNEDFLPKYVLAILASKFISYLYVNTSSIATKDDFRQTTLTEVRNLPIVHCAKEKQQLYADKADNIMRKKLDLIKLQSQFLTVLQSKVTLEKPNNKLQGWYELEFKEFVKELEKAKVKFSLADTAEWMNYFEEQKKKAMDLKNEIEKTDKEIDRMVYGLYELTEEEVKIVEGR